MVRYSLKAHGSASCWITVHARSVYSSELPLMSDALDAYVQIKGPDKSKLFAPHAKRNVSYLIECPGDRPLVGNSR